MKRTLRVLFLAVLAMTLMASVAFAGAAKASFDVLSLDKVVTSVVLSADGKSSVVVKVHVNLSHDAKHTNIVSIDVTSTDTNGLITIVEGKHQQITDSKDVTVTIKSAKTVATVTPVEVTISFKGSGDSTAKVSKTVTVNVTPVGAPAATSPDIKSITATAVTVAAGETATTTAIITVSPDKTNSYELKSKDITVTAATSGIATVVVSGDPKSSDKGMTFTVTIAVTGAKAGSTDITVEVNNKTKFNSVEAKGTFKATVTEGGGGSTSTFSWSNTEDLQEADVVLYVDSKGEVVVSKDFAVTLKVPSDYDSSTVTFVVLDEDGEEYAFDNWEVTDDGGSETDSTDIYEYVLTFIPSASQDKASYTMYATVDDEDGNTVSTDTIAFTVAVLVSSDATTEDTTYTLKMEEPKVSATEIAQGQEATVTIAVTPMRPLGTYTFKYEGDDETFDVTEVGEDQDTSAQTNYVKYTLQPGLDAETTDYTFTFTVTSGDGQAVSTDVTFTVTSVKDLLDSMTDPKDRKAYFQKNRAPAPTLGTVDKSTKVWKFRMTYPVPVHSHGWLLSFRKKTDTVDIFKVLYKLMLCLVKGGTSSNEAAALISVLGMADVADNEVAVKTEADSDAMGASYEMDQDVVETTTELDNAEYEAEPRVIPAVYAEYVDGTVTSDDVASKPAESAGTVQGAGSGGGGTTTDEILPGSSGGCDAGFGTLALALAATLFLSKKRS